MRAHTITIMSRRRRQARRYRALALALGISTLVIPVTASAAPDGGYSSVNAITSESDESHQPVGGSGYSSVNSIAPPVSEQSSSSSSGYSSLNAITGPSTAESALASGSPANAADGFDWESAAVGVGAALALVALGGAVLLTVRRRTGMSPSTFAG